MPDANFDEHAVAIAKRQYLQPGDGDIFGMFRRVADWVARPEKEDEREAWSQRFYELMSNKRFCPGGRVLAGAATSHGNVLNCFVQGATDNPPESLEGIMEVAKKLALVTKVGGGNGVNLDPYRSSPSAKSTSPRRGYAYLRADHPDVEDFIRGLMRPSANPDGEKTAHAVRNWTRVIYGEITPEIAALAREKGVLTLRNRPKEVIEIEDDMGGIMDAAAEAARLALSGEEPHVDFTKLRHEGAPVRSSGGTASGPTSYLIEIYDNFLEWANRGGPDAGPVATLRYVYAPVLRVVRQGGCLHPDTLVHTSRGTLRLRELVDPYHRGWQPHHLLVATDEGWKESPEGYNNGIARTLKVTLENGLEIQGTPNHKLKVMRPDGRREWVPLSELQPGDWVIQALDHHTGVPVTLAPLDETHPNAKEISPPEVLNEDLAFLLGYFFGDGFVSGDRVGVSVSEHSPMLEKAPELFKKLFGLELQKQQKPNDRSVLLTTRSAALVQWLRQNDLLKDRADKIEIPRPIRQSPRNVLGAFLRGLFEADGTITAGYPTLSTASKRLAQDVMVALGGLGIPAKLLRYNPLPGRFSKKEHYRLRVTTAKGLERFLERVGVLSGSRLEKLHEFKPDLRRESSWPLPHVQALLEPAFAETVPGRKGHPSNHTPVRKQLSRYLRGERRLTATGYERLRQEPWLRERLPELDYDEYYVPVRSIEPGEAILTLDLSVNENHTYLANGVVSHNTRRGAGMATLEVSHPDLLDFLTAKDLDREAAEGDISTFNISVLITNRFIEALESDALWPVEPKEVPGKYYPVFLEGEYSGRLPTLPEREDGARPVPVYKGGVPAKWIWHEIAWHAWATGEPGLIFIDRVNEKSALKGLGKRWEIRATNPCGEIPLTVGEPCDLGAMNLAAYVREDKTFDFESFGRDVRTAVRFLDNVLDVNHFVLEDNRRASQTLRRLGLGVMGLADALIKMDLAYDSEEARAVVERIMDEMRKEATAASEELAEERGVFPLYAEHEEYFKELGVRPRRNVALLTVAPTGTTSMLMGVSSGIEPVFAPFVWRRIGGEYKALVHPLFRELLEAYPPHPDYEKDGGWDWERVTERIQENHGSVQGLDFVPESLQKVFKCAHDVNPLDHVRMQGVVQRAFDREGYVGNSLSKTINLPNHASVEDVEAAYTEAWHTGCKGITVYRDGSREYQVINTTKKKESAVPEKEKKEKPQSPEKEAPAAELAARPFGKPVFERTGRLFGFTDMVKLNASDGTRYSYLITVNMQGEHPIEVILTTGRAGDEQNADAEALGRVVSIALQYGVPPEAIIHTLRGINGGLYGNYAKKFVASKGDLIALALEQALKLGNGEKHPLLGGKAAASPQPPSEAESEDARKPAAEGPTCPECGGPVKVEDGCLTCQVCGWSKCG